MKQSQLMIDLSGMIEFKINQRNELSKKENKPVGVIAIIDREIDILLKIESFIPSLEMSHRIAIHKVKKDYFEKGRQAGQMTERTGRDHSVYFWVS